MIQLVKGTKDIYGAEVKAWQEIEGKMRRICETFGIGEIRTPAFEFTELFARGVGETTDIVQKEMYTFTDDGDRSLTLRPVERQVQCVHISSMECTTTHSPQSCIIFPRPSVVKIHRQADKDSSTSSALKCLAPTVRRRMQRLSLLQLLYWRN